MSSTIIFNILIFKDLSEELLTTLTVLRLGEFGVISAPKPNSRSLSVRTIHPSTAEIDKRKDIPRLSVFKASLCFMSAIKKRLKSSLVMVSFS